MSAAPTGAAAIGESVGLRRYRSVRADSVAVAAPLSAEDQTLQSMPDASPTKWHLAHTSWFFEAFLLEPHLPGYRRFDPMFGYLFNSYYEAVGARHPRPQRGMVSRPGVAEIAAYRAHVDEAMAQLCQRGAERRLAALVELGLRHEQQHQELILMDIKHALSLNPMQPAYRRSDGVASRQAPPLTWQSFAGGLHRVGHAGAGFAFDNEGPRHRLWLEPFRLATRVVSNGEYLAFIEAGGYRRPEFWLADGWVAVQAHGWTAPLYWQQEDRGGWSIFTLGGRAPLDTSDPVCHVSYYEADAFAKWAGRRLPREPEWEVAATTVAVTGNFADTGRLHPAPASDGDALQQMYGDVWEWTSSAYEPYPGFRPTAGAVGEYNGKFMSGQMVLRGGCAITPPGHVTATYRNFFPPSARWAFSGIRLAEDA